MTVSAATRRQLASLGVLAVLFVGSSLLFSPRAVLESMSALSSHLLVFLTVMLVLYLARPFLMWPVSVLSITVGYALGVTYGFPVAMAGTLCSNTIPFLIARYARSDRGLVGFASRSSEQFVSMTGELRGVVAARLSPLPADVVSSASGLSNVSLGAYLLGTLVGESPWIAAEVVAGASMHSLSVHGLSHSLSLFAGATALSALLLAGPIYRRVDQHADLSLPG